MSARDYLDEALLNFLAEALRFSVLSAILFIFLAIKTYKLFRKIGGEPTSSKSIFSCLMWVNYNLDYYRMSRFDKHPSKEIEKQHKAFIADILFYAHYFYDSLEVFEKFFNYSFSRLRLNSFIMSIWSFDYTRRQVQYISKPITYIIILFYGPFFPNPFTIIFCMFYVRLFLYFILFIIYFRDRS